ncbi:MFS transporter [Methylocystis sp. MJC1]|jgi:EmrB/QacA subfamily drug resistance transporter|uniref:MFS transporter n=1 Tax=Methylocystis sp. MJC1 TaxID=2654282 RepID=UPI0013EB3AC8|nr:MFS transporter [Methylocystis sp. MJC1]KAF2992444.1 putative transport protein HsrA [Methylocystis sp. MJC1]MBU6526423.1 MFS transporter [Methylocystis sp. MJC1]UZX12865.1 MFS transporter [Methylocystis sp. MJC1]
MEEHTIKRFLPWVVATALFMEQLDATIVNTAVPAMAESLQVSPLSLKAVAASYVLSLAVGIPVSGWMADRYGTRKVFAAAIAVFTVSSILCGLSQNAGQMVVARILQGAGAALMTPVGRLTVVRTFEKAELLTAMNFVIIPALVGPLLGPTVGGLIVHWFSWRDIFFVNVPIGLIAQWLVHRYMPNYVEDTRRPFDWVGLALFGSGTALLSWLLEIFGEHQIRPAFGAGLFAIAMALLLAYWAHARRAAFPLLDLALFKKRTFRVSVTGGFVTRLGVGGLPFLTPLLFQVGLGLPAWESGLLMMPTAAAAMGMKFISAPILARFGYRTILVTNTVMIGVTTGLYSLVTANTPLEAVVAIGFALGFFNSLQFTSMNSLAYADVEPLESSMAATIASSFQQVSMSFGLAIGSLAAAWFLGAAPQSNPQAVIGALHNAYLFLGGLTVLSSLSFWRLRAYDGASVSGAQAEMA